MVKCLSFAEQAIVNVMKCNINDMNKAYTSYVQAMKIYE